MDARAKGLAVPDRKIGKRSAQNGRSGAQAREADDNMPMRKQMFGVGLRLAPCGGERCVWTALEAERLLGGGKAFVTFLATHSAVGFVVTLIQTKSLWTGEQ